MSTQALKAIDTPPTNPVGYDEYGRAKTARNNNDLAAYRRTDDAYDASAGTYDVQSLSYSAIDSFDTTDGKWKTMRDGITETKNKSDYLDERWIAVTDAAVQRFLDLRNDSSGKVTFAMKLQLETQALFVTDTRDDSAEVQRHGKVEGFSSFNWLVQEYLDKGTTRAAISLVGHHRFATLDQREIVEKMVKTIADVESKFQPPTPGKKEADALLNRIWEETQLDGERDRFGIGALLFVR